MRICCLNNYPLEKMRRLATSGSMPTQHVWGLDALARAGHDIEIAPFHEPGERHPLDLASRWSRLAFGQIDQELFALGSRCDVFYSADNRSARGLALLRSVVRRPIVSVLHHPVGESAVNRAAMRGTDAALCLSPRVRDGAERLGARQARFVPWGPDLSSAIYRREISEERGVVSAGKTNRDLTTLAQALRIARQRGVIYDLEGQLRDLPPGTERIGPGGEGRDPDAPGAYLATRVLHDLARASLVAIPGRSPAALIGLTEVNDALAFGKPIVMTRLASFPFDLEEVGCGILIEPGDVGGWAAALERLADPVLRREMGARGRRFAERTWHYARFGEELVKIMQGL